MFKSYKYKPVSKIIDIIKNNFCLSFLYLSFKQIFNKKVV